MEDFITNLRNFFGWTPEDTSMDPEKNDEWQSHQGKSYEAKGIGKIAPADTRYSDENTTEGVFYWTDENGDKRAGRLIFQIDDAFNDEDTPTRVYGAILDDGSRIGYSDVQKLFQTRSVVKGYNPKLYRAWQRTQYGDGERVLSRAEMSEEANQKTIEDITASNRAKEELKEPRELLKQPLPKLQQRFFDNLADFYKR